MCLVFANCQRSVRCRDLSNKKVEEAKRVTVEQKKYYVNLIAEMERQFDDVQKQLRVEIAELNQEIKEKQKEIFSLMEEMERKEKEWKEKEADLIATIKEREREIDQLKTEMKSPRSAGCQFIRVPVGRCPTKYIVSVYRILTLIGRDIRWEVVAARGRYTFVYCPNFRDLKTAVVQIGALAGWNGVTSPIHGAIT